MSVACFSEYPANDKNLLLTLSRGEENCFPCWLMTPDDEPTQTGVKA